jgi:hypothetical protein
VGQGASLVVELPSWIQRHLLGARVCVGPLDTELARPLQLPPGRHLVKVEVVHRSQGRLVWGDVSFLMDLDEGDVVRVRLADWGSGMRSWSKQPVGPAESLASR